MGKVHLLTDQVSNQIAAGEVIERPSAVVKELVENALDAGATRIEVEFRHGGRSLMRVEDNGSGMSEEDALLGLQRHATSKISLASDLDRLMSFGFRGEALPSIASVSRFTLQTREAEVEAGTEILINAGKIEHVRACGMPVGTRIEVAHLFAPVPARRKFLKRDQTEAAHIINGVRLYALAFPGVSFTLIEDGRVIFRSPQVARFQERIAEIFGAQIAEPLIEIEAAESGLRLSGLIGRPGAGRATRHEMITFVNQRPVDSRTLNYALIESYHEILPKGRYPLAFVFLDIDPAAVDVNVHPAKREVRFRQESQIRGFVIRSVLQRLRELETYRDLVIDQAPRVEPLPPVSSPPASTAWVAQDGAIRAPVAARSVSPSTTAEVSPSVVPAAVPAIAVSSGADALRQWRFLGAAHGHYGIFETPAGVLLLDRRAAHERVWFERLQETFAGERIASQRLLLPVPLELDPIGSALLVDRLKFLQEHGVGVEEFGRNFFRIDAVPTWMEPEEAEAFVREFLGAAREGRFPEKSLDASRAELARIASRRAGRLPGDHDSAAWLSLARALLASRQPHTSPMGKPTMVEIGHGELGRRFHRSG